MIEKKGSEDPFLNSAWDSFLPSPCLASSLSIPFGGLTVSKPLQQMGVRYASPRRRHPPQGKPSRIGIWQGGGPESPPTSHVL